MLSKYDLKHYNFFFPQKKKIKKKKNTITVDNW